MSTLKDRISQAEKGFQRLGSVSVVSPTASGGGSRKDLKTNRELINYTKAEIRREILRLKKAAGVIFRLESLFGRKGKRQEVYQSGTNIMVTREQLAKYRQAYRVAMDNVASSLGALTKRVRRSSDSSLFTGPNALTYIDGSMASFLNGSVGVGVFAQSVGNLRNQLAARVGGRSEKVKGVDVFGDSLVSQIDAALVKLSAQGVTSGNTLGEVLNTLFTVEGIPAAVSRFVLITAPHLVKNYRKNVLSEADTEARLALGDGKFVRPYYKVTEEFAPIMDTIRRLQKGQTGADAIAIARQKNNSGKIPPVIFESGYLWYSLTAVQKLNSPHSAKKSLTGDEMSKLVDGSNNETKLEVNQRILQRPASEWPMLWAQIGTGASASVVNTAENVLQLFKAVYNAAKFKV